MYKRAGCRLAQVEELSCCWNRATVWAGNQALWGHGRQGMEEQALLKYMGKSPRMESFNPWYLVSGEFLHFYQRLMWPAYVCTAHQCMPGQAAGQVLFCPLSSHPCVCWAGQSAHLHQPQDGWSSHLGDMWVEAAEGSFLLLPGKCPPTQLQPVKARYYHATTLSLQWQQ